MKMAEGQKSMMTEQTESQFQKQTQQVHVNDT